MPGGSVDDSSHIPVEGRGCRYWDAQGNEYLDFSSGIFTNTFGHGCARLNRSGYEQAKRLANIHARHSQAELMFYRRLFEHLPAGDYKAIPYNDGGYTIDRGLTDIVNYYNKKRIAIGAYRNGFHGKTQAAKLLINETEKASLYDNFQIDFPNCYRCSWNGKPESCDRECVKAACKILQEKKAGALIFEPVQGAGIVIPPKDYWQLMQNFCRREGVLLFADEVLTGGGRTGSYLASTQFGLLPDMIALTKGLANGKPLSVLLEREYLTKNRYAMRPMERDSTFAAHPEALAVAAELLQMIKEKELLAHVRCLEAPLKVELAALKERFSIIGEVRSLGLMGAVEFVRDKQTKEPFAGMGMTVLKKCRKNGLEAIGGDYILRLAPPLIIEQKELLSGLKILERSIEEVQKAVSG